jgi:hypothetical protein
MLIFKNLDVLKHYDSCKTWQQKRYIENIAYGNVEIKKPKEFLKQLKIFSLVKNQESVLISVNKMTMKEIVVENFVLKLKNIFPCIFLKKQIQNYLILKRLNIKEILCFLKDVEQYIGDSVQQIDDLNHFHTILKANPSIAKQHSNLLHILKCIQEQNK